MARCRELTGHDRATEMDVTMVGLQNAGKTSLLRVLSVRSSPGSPAPVTCHDVLMVLRSARAASSPTSKDLLASPQLPRLPCSPGDHFDQRDRPAASAVSDSDVLG